MIAARGLGLTPAPFSDVPRLLTAAEQIEASSESSATKRDERQSRLLRALIATLWSQWQFLDTGQTQKSLESVLSALNWIGPGEEYTASFALMYMAFSYQAIGQGDGAIAVLNEALEEHATHRSSTAGLLFALSFVYLAAGKLHQVEYTARHLLHLAQQGGLTLSQNVAHWLLGVVSYEGSDLDTAVYHFSAVITNRHLAHFWVVREALFGLTLSYQAQGLGTQAKETVRALLEWMQEQHNVREIMTAYAFCGHLALVQDDVEQASQWLEMAREDEELGPMMYIEDQPVTRAWLLLAQGDEMSVARGQALLTHLLHHVEARHTTRKTIQVLVLQAWAYEAQGRMPEALEVLERAIALARPRGFLRTFADLTQLSRVLHELRKRRRSQKAFERKFDTYVQHILAAMNS